MKKLILTLLLLLLGYHAQAQEADTIGLFVFNRDTILYAPPPSVEAIYLHASPLKSGDTPGNKIRPKDWVNVYYPPEHRIRRYAPHTPSCFIHQTKHWWMEELDYRFFYTGAGEPITRELFQQTKFTSLSAALKQIRAYPVEAENIWTREHNEVSRWQYPKLYVVAYDKERAGYYRYRIIVTIYCDASHPNAFRIEE